MMKNKRSLKKTVLGIIIIILIVIIVFIQIDNYNDNYSTNTITTIRKSDNIENTKNDSNVVLPTRTDIDVQGNWTKDNLIIRMKKDDQKYKDLKGSDLINISLKKDSEFIYILFERKIDDGSMVDDFEYILIMQKERVLQLLVAADGSSVKIFEILENVDAGPNQILIDSSEQNTLISVQSKPEYVLVKIPFDSINKTLEIDDISDLSYGISVLSRKRGLIDDSQFAETNMI